MQLRHIQHQSPPREAYVTPTSPADVPLTGHSRLAAGMCNSKLWSALQACGAYGAVPVWVGEKLRLPVGDG